MNEENEISVELTDDEYSNIVMMYIETVMRDESKHQFYSVLDETGDIKEALFASVVNETINTLLERFINELKDNPDMLAEVQALAEQHHKENHE